MKAQNCGANNPLLLDMEPLTLDQIDEAPHLILENARALLEESKILADKRHFARSYALAHIAGEEVVKLDALVEAAILLADKKPVDWQSVDRRLRLHTQKIRAIFEPVLRASSFDVAAKGMALDRLVAGINDLKNYALYVGQRRGAGPAFRSPDDLDEELARNAYAAVHAQFGFYESILGAKTGPLRDIVQRVLEERSKNKRETLADED